jgi:hypothetical protein
MALHVARTGAVRDQQLQPGDAAGVKRSIGSQPQDDRVDQWRCRAYLLSARPDHSREPKLPRRSLGIDEEALESRGDPTSHPAARELARASSVFR